jgi:hypothetical protein
MKFNYAMELLSFHCISLLVILCSGLMASAQDDNDSITDSGSQLSIEAIAGIVGLASIVSGGVSAVINLVIENYRSRKKIRLEDTFNRHRLYKEIIYDLERMLYSVRFQKATEPESEVEETFAAIHKLMREHYLLVEEEIKDEWHKVSSNWRESFIFQSNPMLRLELALRVIKLRDLLVKNYNKSAEKFPQETGGYSRVIELKKWPAQRLNYLKEYIIWYAIEQRKKIEFTHNGRIIKCEPQVLGILKGISQLFASETKGESSCWSRIKLDEIDITTLKITEEKFEKPKPFPPKEESLWDRKINETKYDGRTISDLINEDYDEDEEDEDEDDDNNG